VIFATLTELTICCSFINFHFCYIVVEVGRSRESSAPLPATETRRCSEPRLKRNKVTAASTVLAVAAFTVENQDDMDDL
jgi:hypothetical protein